MKSIKTTVLDLNKLNVQQTIKPSFALTKFIIANEINKEELKAYLINIKENKAILLEDMTIDEVYSIFEETSTKNKVNDIGWYANSDLQNDVDTFDSKLDYTISELADNEYIINGYRITE